jgi:hypothetical protein
MPLLFCRRGRSRGGHGQSKCCRCRFGSPVCSARGPRAHRPGHAAGSGRRRAPGPRRCHSGMLSQYSAAAPPLIGPRFPASSQVLCCVCSRLLSGSLSHPTYSQNLFLELAFSRRYKHNLPLLCTQAALQELATSIGQSLTNAQFASGVNHGIQANVRVGQRMSCGA